MERNYQSLQTLLAQLSNAEEEPLRERMGSKERWQGYVWTGVSSTLGNRFLSRYETHTSANRVNTQLLSEFITKMNEVGELTHWTIALIGSKDAGSRWPIVDDLSVGMLVRQDNKVQGRYSIGRLLSPRDEGIDLNEAQWSSGLELSRKVIQARPRKRPCKPSGCSQWTGNPIHPRLWFPGWSASCRKEWTSSCFTCWTQLNRRLPN